MDPVLLHELWLVGLLVGLMLFAHWFTYCVGSPLAEPTQVNPGAILFFLPYQLAKWRLRGRMFDDTVEMWRDQRAMTNNPVGEVQALRDHRLNVVLQGRELFGWERGLLCPVCLHWWLSLYAGGAWLALRHVHDPSLDLAVGALTYLFLHFIIRKI